MRQYFLIAFAVACLAYSLYFGFVVDFNQPLGTHDMLGAYFYIFFLHMPLWIMIFLITGMFNQRISKLKNINLILKISICVLIGLFLIPIFDKDSRKHFDYLNLLFYIVDFVCCFIIFVKILQKQNLNTK